MKRKPAKKRDDSFFHWDSLDLENLFEDFTDYEDERVVVDPEDSSSEEETQNSRNSPMATSGKGRHLLADITNTAKNQTDRAARHNTYCCPLCQREYRSQAGFRGHMIKKHDRPDIKASRNRMGQASVDSMPGYSCSLPMTEAHGFRMLFTANHPQAVEKIITDEFLSLSALDHGQEIQNAARDLQGVTDLKPLEDLLFPVYNKFSTYPTWTSDSEQLMSRYWKCLTSQESVDVFQQMLPETDPSVVVKLIPCYLRRFQDLFMASCVETVRKTVNHNAERLSEDDSDVLHYICGFILRKLFKRVSAAERELLESLHTTSKEESEHCRWTSMCDRGGLLYATKPLTKLIFTCEWLLRNSTGATVDKDSIKIDKTLEMLLDNHFVKFQWQVCDPSDNHHVLEKILKLFVTIRGFALAKQERKRMASGTKSHKALRKSLRDKVPAQ